MTAIPRGRGGWPSKFHAALGATALLAAVGLLASCASKKSAAPGGAGGAGPGLNEQGLGGAGSNASSLAQYQRGTLGAGGAGGPLTDIHFDYDDYAVRPQDSAILRRNAQWITSHGDPRVQIEGHCDQRGSEEYNIALGAKRAQATKDYLATLGVPADRLSTISYGKELPLCNEQTEECYEQNRRAHFVVLQK
jgi:peptidoglycan-associated lipoprotein